MSHQARPTFRHRRNLSGVIDSICLECLLTVASARVELEHQLNASEEAHICDPLQLHRLKAERPPSSLGSRGFETQ